MAQLALLEQTIMDVYTVESFQDLGRGATLLAMAAESADMMAALAGRNKFDAPSSATPMLSEVLGLLRISVASLSTSAMGAWCRSKHCSYQLAPRSGIDPLSLVNAPCTMPLKLPTSVDAASERLQHTHCCQLACAMPANPVRFQGMCFHHSYCQTQQTNPQRS